jgi:uncharacterized protein YceH (UPF0502 family)
MDAPQRLDPVEARVLGVLIEKEFTTPEQYPLTLNALHAGCNQKSNRFPMMELSEVELRGALERLRLCQLVGAAHAAGGRAERFRHNAREVWGWLSGELAVMAELLLRGPQTSGDLRGRAARMHALLTLEDLERVLGPLREKGVVATLAPLPGSRAPRHGATWIEVAELAGVDSPTAVAASDVEARLRALEARVEALEAARGTA